MHKILAPDGFDLIEGEKYIRFGIIFDVIFYKNIPLGKVIRPIAEFHVKTAIHALVMHLGVETFPVGHGGFPFFTNRGYRHKITPK